MPAGPNGDAFTFVGGSNLMMFKGSENKNEAWEVMKFLSQDQVQTDYASLLGHVPGARRSPRRPTASPAARTSRRSTRRSSRAGRTRRSRSGRAIENAYKGRFGNILDSAAGRAATTRDETVQKQLDEAAKEADGLLAQTTG